MNVIETLNAKIDLCTKAVNILLNNPATFKEVIESLDRKTHIGIFDDVRLEIGFYEYGDGDFDHLTGEQGFCLGLRATAKLRGGDDHLRDYIDIEVEVDLDDHNCHANYLSTLINLIERFEYAQYELEKELANAKRHLAACGPDAPSIELALVSGNYEPAGETLRLRINYNGVNLSLKNSNVYISTGEMSWTETYLEALRDLQGAITEAGHDIAYEIQKVEEILNKVKEK